MFSGIVSTFIFIIDWVTRIISSKRKSFQIIRNLNNKIILILETKKWQANKRKYKK